MGLNQNEPQTVSVVTVTNPSHQVDTVSYEIKLKNRKFTPDPSESATLKYDTGGGQHYVVLQFTSLPTVEELVKFNIESLNYVSQNAIIASVPDGFDWQSVPKVRWIGKLLSSDKVSSVVTEQLNQEQPGGQITLSVEAFRDVPAEELEAIVREVGGTAYLHPALPSYVSLVTGSKDVFDRLAKEDKIAWITQTSLEIASQEQTYFCPGPLTPYGPVANFVANGDGWDGPGQGSAELTYHFVNGTPDIAGTADNRNDV